MSTVLLPGATLGVLGNGQLGRMFALAARRMGYRVATFGPGTGTPAGQVCDLEVDADYRDEQALRAFARQVEAVTFEFENVPAEAGELLAEHVPVRPRETVLHIAQNRWREKTWLRDQGFPVGDFATVESEAALVDALERLGTPAVLKTAGFGYDGKGQALIRTPADAAGAWQAIGGQAAVLEAFVDFHMEVSVVAARGTDGSFAHYGVFENRHRDHILDVTLPDAPVGPQLREQAEDIARGILEALGVVGVLCVEFFVASDGRLLVNELAPRPHNSGHLTFDASLSSQFEQQVRAVAGLPLGDTRLLRPAAMVNLLGDLWQDGEPDWAAALADGQTKLHLYGKANAKPGRKMGHLTAFGDDREDAARRALAARERLRGGGGHR
ncbi:5-(carboxyamino)imidazole ribonucleotide synthase [Alkalispirillum mobile]|uniref:N5-carboxyaminoimidazole ribonucleotide synthase n=1 Tax=Alkalispirillum mobile TaxID=85925 RepID=A0A498BTK9_9GAMM|nr:5-(carboxyamino)imidazole ribonucleotide synthase [Alkalispirillum mobile]RLK46277.1 5-(carboxyamino)imidazole ribonucleotide synthase [Alkalispirillum mobile]